MKRKEIRVRCWVDVEGEKFFGPGRVELLEHIRESGSIVKAAKAMSMSYKKAWDMVEELNTRGRRPFVITRKGGQEGGGAELTETGKRAVAAFKKLNKKIQDITNKETDLLKLI